MVKRPDISSRLVSRRGSESDETHCGAVRGALIKTKNNQIGRTEPPRLKMCGKKKKGDTDEMKKKKTKEIVKPVRFATTRTRNMCYRHTRKASLAT